jgi:hypothetical protein
MKYTMNTKELARLAVIKSAIDGAYTVKQAAGKLGISSRWVKALKKAVREHGDGVVIHGSAHAASGQHHRRGPAEKEYRVEKKRYIPQGQFHPLSGTA